MVTIPHEEVPGSNPGRGEQLVFFKVSSKSLLKTLEYSTKWGGNVVNFHIYYGKDLTTSSFEVM